MAHNGQRYDGPGLKKCHPGWDPISFCLSPQARQGHCDTLVVARLVYPNIKMTDSELVLKGRLKSVNHGKDKLEAWGQRVGIHKATYEGGFDAWSQAMQDYCLQDCRTGVALWEHLKVETLDPRSFWLEHRVNEICFKMETAGWPFNEKKAGALYTTLVTRKDELEKSLVAKYGTWEEVDRIFTPKRDDKKRGYVKGVEVTKYKTVTFNPGSRIHCIKQMMEAGWKPEEFTPSGQAQLNEEVLESLNVPEAKEIIEFLTVQKRLGQLADGDKGWLKMVRNGHVHASYNPMGTVTGRASHFRPNIAQVPACGAPYGEECRDLFEVRKGFKLLGADFEGLELRCLAHYMFGWDAGEYAFVVTDGDPHWRHTLAMGLTEAARDPDNLLHKILRDGSKTFTYGFLYGCGDGKAGRIVRDIINLLRQRGFETEAILLTSKFFGTGKITDAKLARAGKELKGCFLAGLGALGKLSRAVKEKVSGKKRDGIVVIPGRPWLKGLDGRQIPVRSEHAALNSLLQSAGAVLCKTWLVNTYNTLLTAGFQWGWDGDFVIVGWIHDELQIAVREGLESAVGAIVVRCAQEAGKAYDFKVRLDSKYVVGNTWKDTH